MIIPGVLRPIVEQAIIDIREIENFADLVHIDVVDNKLYEGKTITEIEDLLKLESMADLELHLMVQNPKDYVESHLKGYTRVCAQVEAGQQEIDLFIQNAKSSNFEKIGLSISPDTDIMELESFLDKIDYVQFMTVVPGAQGKSYRDDVLQKIIEFKAKHPNMELQVDGAMNSETIPQVTKTGVENIVVGSAIFKKENSRKAYVELDQLLENCLNVLNLEKE